MRTRHSILCGLALLASAAHGQLLLTDSILPIDLAQALAGTGVQVSNAMFNGSSVLDVASRKSGVFDGSACSIGLPSGVILCTGNIAGALGPNDHVAMDRNVTDPYFDQDIEDLNGQMSFDAAVLEFDIVPTGDSIILEYVFASEEYPEFVCALSNDMVGIFISGPGIQGPYSNQGMNIALVPNTMVPVCVNSINPGTAYFGLSGIDSAYCEAVDLNWHSHAALYVDNGTGMSHPQDTSAYYVQYDGFTTPIVARAAVQAGQTYHLRIGVADANDTFWDSGLFLMSNGLTSGIGSRVEEVTMGAAQVFIVGDEALISLPQGAASDQQLVLIDVAGRVLRRSMAVGRISRFPIHDLSPGAYILSFPGASIASVRFVRQ